MDASAPSSGDSSASARFSFSPFAQHDFFTHVNQWIVDRVVRPAPETVVDLGCGPGAVTRLIVEKLDGVAGARVIGIDPSPSALARARADITAPWVEFHEGTAEHLSGLVPQADAILFLNAIHLIADKSAVLAEIRRVLKPRGRFAFNTTFFNGAYESSTSGFWRRWVVRAMQVLKERGISVHHDPLANRMQWMTPDEYGTLCRAAGLDPSTVELLRVDLPPECLADIGRFSLFIEGALPGVPLEIGSEALQLGLARALDELQLTSLPRYWLEIIAKAI
ncbi:MAG: class I SAM-dependent methyltransferase [Gemmatimonadota bacterium]|nr:class I SAM-dependent methyltransferase [Gemmatimonadota bacterium]